MKVHIIFIFQFITVLICNGQAEHQVTTLYREVLENDRIQSAAFTSFEKNIYIGYVVKGVGKSKVSIQDLRSNFNWEASLEINGAWEIKWIDNFLFIGGEDGNLYQMDILTKKVDKISSPYKTEKPIITLEAGMDHIFVGTYPNGLVWGYNPRTKKYLLNDKSIQFEKEKYIRSMVYSPTKNELYLGTGAVNSLLAGYNFRTNSIQTYSSFAKQGFSFVYHMVLLENVDNRDLLFCRLTGNGKSQTIFYSVSENKFSDFYENIDFASIVKYQNNRLYYTKEGNFYNFEVRDNKIVNEKLVGKGGGATIASIITGSDFYVINRAGIIRKINLINNKVSVISTVGDESRNAKQALKLHLLYRDDEQNLWVSGFQSEGGIAKIMPKTNDKKTFNGLNQSEVIFKDQSKVYFGEYPGAKLFYYDSKYYWNVEDQNPRLIYQALGQDRIVTAVKATDSRTIYFGTVPEYGKLGGALLEVKDKKVRELKPFKDRSIVSLLYKNELLYSGTSINGGLGSHPKEREGKVFVWDPKNEKVIRDFVPVNGEIAVTDLINIDDEHLMGMAGGTLFVYNIKKHEVINKIKIYNASKSYLTVDAKLHLIGDVVYLSGNRNIYKVNIIQRNVEKIIDEGSHLVFDGHKTFYYLSGSTIKSFNIQ